MPRWTDNQKNAINSIHGSVLVSAAAGSGKTAVLKERVIKMITSGESPVPADRLLVVTFTKAAAAEMKQRINSSLNKLIEQNPGSERLLSQKQRLYNANISTTDSFCGKLVREYFHTLDISPDYRIAEDGEAAILQRKALDSVFTEFYAEGTASFKNLLNAFSSKNGDQNLRSAVLEISKFLDTQPFPEELLDKLLGLYNKEWFSETVWAEIILGDVAGTVDYLTGYIEKSFKLIKAYKLLDEKLAPVLKADIAALNQIKSAAASGDWNAACESVENFAFQKFPLFGKKEIASNPKAYSAFVKDEVKNNRDFVKKDIKKIVDKAYLKNDSEATEELKSVRELLKTLFGLVKAYRKELEALKRKKSVFTFSDIALFTVRLLASYDEELGFVKTARAEEISKRFDAVIVDEYQDVNDVQEVIYKCVSDNEKNLFVVGDVKQSIYGFRQAKPEIFNRRKESYGVYNPDSPSYPAKVFLDMNFRSRKEICDTVNFIFSRIMSESDYSRDDYLNSAEPYPYPETDKCNTEITVINKSSFDEGLSNNALEAQYVASKIMSMISSGFTVTDKNGRQRPAQFQDFAVIMRSKSDGSDFSKDDESKKKGTAEFVKNLMLCGIPAYCEESESFFDNQEIKVLLNLLRIIDNPSSDIALLSVLCSPIYGFTPDELAQIRANSRYSNLYDALLKFRDKSEKTADFLEDLSLLRRCAQSSSVDELLGIIYEKTALAAITSAVKGGTVPESNLNLMREYAEKYEEGGYKTLSDFIGYIDRMIEGNKSLASAQKPDNDALKRVAVMSIHKSKGLEFPVCFLVDAARGFNKKGLYAPVLTDSKLGVGIKRKYGLASLTTLAHNAIAIKAEQSLIEEEMRLLYVALTRAREKLIVTATVDDADKYLYSQAELLQNASLSPYVISTAKCMLDWITLTAADNTSVSAKMGGADSADLTKDFPVWELKVIKSLSGLTCGAAESEADLIAAEKHDEKPVTSVDYAEILKKNLSFVYSNKDILDLPQKVSASQIAHNRNTFMNTVIAKPGFLNGKSLSAVEKGTAHHVFLQYCDFENARKNVSAEVERLASSGRLTRKQAECIDTDKMEQLLKNPLFDRIIGSEKIYREQRFISEIAPEMIDEKYKGVKTDAGVIMQGEVDLAFEENGRLVIVDYKTDRVKSMDKLAKLYRKQLELYREAMRQSLEIEVSELIICSIHLNDFVNV